MSDKLGNRAMTNRLKNGKYVNGVPGINAGVETNDYVTFETGSSTYAFRLNGQK